MNSLNENEGSDEWIDEHGASDDSWVEDGKCFEKGSLLDMLPEPNPPFPSIMSQSALLLYLLNLVSNPNSEKMNKNDLKPIKNLHWTEHQQTKSLW